MTDGEIAKRLVDALTAEADRESGARTGLVSVVVERLSPQAPDRLQIKLERKTKTLIFLRAEYFSGDVRAAIAASVHKVLD